MNPFQIMCEPIRRRILEILASGEHSSGILTAAITQEFGVTRSAVSWHLAILRDNGWIDIREEYTSRFYRLEPDAIRMLRDAVERLERLWERRIGIMAKNDPQPEHAFPIDGDPAGRLAPGVAKGMRGRGVRNDIWSPRPKKKRLKKKRARENKRATTNRARDEKPE